MDINDFKTFLEVSHTRHFGQAAARLHITQSTVSARIRQLERQLGCSLFSRERNNIRLTPAGEKFHAHAEHIVAAWNRARAELGAGQPEQIPLGIGATANLWDALLNAWLPPLYQQHPNLRIYGEVLSHDTLLRRLGDNSLDLGLVFDPVVNEPLAAAPLTEIRLQLVAAQPCTVAQALAGDYLLVDWGPYFMQRHAELFTALAPPRLQLGAAHSVLAFLHRHGGSAYLADALLDTTLPGQTLHIVANAPPIQCPVYVVYNKYQDKAGLVHEVISGWQATAHSAADAANHTTAHEG